MPSRPERCFACFDPIDMRAQAEEPSALRPLDLRAERLDTNLLRRVRPEQVEYERSLCSCREAEIVDQGGEDARQKAKK